MGTSYNQQTLDASTDQEPTRYQVTLYKKPLGFLVVKKINKPFDKPETLDLESNT